MAKKRLPKDLERKLAHFEERLCAHRPEEEESAKRREERERVELVRIAGAGLDVVQPYVLEGERAQRLLRDIQELSARLDTDLTIEGDIGVILQD